MLILKNHLFGGVNPIYNIYVAAACTAWAMQNITSFNGPRHNATSNLVFVLFFFFIIISSSRGPRHVTTLNFNK